MDSGGIIRSSRQSSKVGDENGEDGMMLLETTSETSSQQALDDDDDDNNVGKGGGRPPSVYTTISILLLGVFIANIDASLVLATYGKVASEFNDLESGSWLFSAYILAQCVAQPFYGKLSDIYGRKACLQVSYVLFTLGTLGCGLGSTMGHVIAARAVQGAGGAGMTSLVSIIITDLVPLNKVAVLRSYVNVLETTGRSCGGVIGGALTQALGWRWAFLIQAPATMIAAVLVQLLLKSDASHVDSVLGQSRMHSLRRIDFVGAVFLSLSIFSICFVLDTGGLRYPWTSPVIVAMSCIFIASSSLYVLSSRFVAEPIFPLRLMAQYSVSTSYIMMLLQTMVQFSLVIFVPIYFQITEKASVAAAGAYLIPAFFGNTLGGLISGIWIKHTGLYKVPTVAAPILSLIAVVLCYSSWKGHTTIFGSLATLPGGMAMGMVSNAVFVGLAVSVRQEDIAISGSGIYLFNNLGCIVGASAGYAVYQNSLAEALRQALRGVDNSAEIVQSALADLTYVQNAAESIRELIIPAFVESFHQVNLLGMICAVVCLMVALFTRQKSLDA